MNEQPSSSRWPKLEPRHLLAITVAYEQGYGHGRRGLKHMNPYAPESSLAESWQLGHDAGSAAQGVAEAVSTEPLGEPFQAILHKHREQLYDAEFVSPAEGPHSDDLAVDQFAAAIKAKLARSRAKGRAGWDDPAQCSERYLAELLVGHLAKGNSGTFEDIAAFAMMLHQRGAAPSLLAEVSRRSLVVGWREAVESIGEFGADVLSDDARAMVRTEPERALRLAVQLTKKECVERLVKLEQQTEMAGAGDSAPSQASSASGSGDDA